MNKYCEHVKIIHKQISPNVIMAEVSRLPANKNGDFNFVRWLVRQNFDFNWCFLMFLAIYWNSRKPWKHWKTLKNGTFGHKKSLRLEAYAFNFAVWTGLEPATPCVTGMYSNQLNYQTNFLRNLSASAEFRNCVMLYVKSVCKIKTIIHFDNTFWEKNRKKSKSSIHTYYNSL